MHAAPYVVWAGFDRDNFEVIVGGLTQFRSSPHAIREFCPNCGSTLTYAKDARGAPELEEAARVIYVAVASLDNPEDYPPDEVVHTLEAIGWMHFADDLPLRDSISPSAGHLQFGGIAESEAAEIAKRRIDPKNGAEN